MLASAHFWVGLVILALVILQILVRVVSARQTGGNLPALRNGSAGDAHFVLLHASGGSREWAVAAYIADEFGDIHATAKPVFIVLTWLHAVPQEASISVPR